MAYNRASKVPITEAHIDKARQSCNDLQTCLQMKYKATVDFVPFPLCVGRRTWPCRLRRSRCRPQRTSTRNQKKGREGGGGERGKKVRHQAGARIGGGSRAHSRTKTARGHKLAQGTAHRGSRLHPNDATTFTLYCSACPPPPQDCVPYKG